jgi:predicted nucleic acid-binding protein
VRGLASASSWSSARNSSPRSPAGVERVTRDPRDDYLVALAKAAEALLVSSDRDVLEAETGDVEVLSAREFLDRLA